MNAITKQGFSEGQIKISATTPATKSYEMEVLQTRLVLDLPMCGQSAESSRILMLCFTQETL
eukprot:1972024-Amphidinium_carterae.1